MRCKWLIIPAFLIATIFLVSEDSRGQGRGGPPDPNKSFDDLARQSGGTDTIDFARLPPETKDKMNRMAQYTGGQPLPATGTMNRQQYTEVYNKRMEGMKAKFGGGDRGGFSGGGDRGGQPGAVVVGGQPGGFGGTQAAPNSDEDNMRKFKDRDRNGDGKISMDEASKYMKPVFQQYDKNGDGFIDYEEFKPYMASMNQMQQGGGDRGGFGSQSGGFGGQGGGSYGGPPPSAPAPGGDIRETKDDRKARDKDEESARVVVYRFGKLPKELPSWFEKYDTDLDGQVGLYEWRRAGEPTAKFVEMDLNGDGYLTAEEWLRFAKAQLDKKPDAVDENGDPIDGSGSTRGSSASRGGPPTRGAPTGRDDKAKDPKAKDDKGSKKNPFGK